MRYYIEAYRGDETQILGNLDGQAAFETNPRKFRLLRKLRTGEDRPKYERVKYWLIVNVRGRLIERIDNPLFGG